MTAITTPTNDNHNVSFCPRAFRISAPVSNTLFFLTLFKDPLLSVSLSCLQAPIPIAPWFS